VNSTLFILERLRQRAHLPALTARDHDLSDALSLLVSMQLGLGECLMCEPDNNAVRHLKRWLDLEMKKLDCNMQGTATDDGVDDE